MAQKIQTLFIDDLDGSEAEGTVRFGLDETEFKIDLNAEHAQALRVALKIYAHCIDGQADAANKRITDALGAQDTQPESR